MILGCTLRVSGFWGLGCRVWGVAAMILGCTLRVSVVLGFRV